MASTGGGSSSREARRRRILERGDDRLALVTGRIQSLPSDADQSRPVAPSSVGGSATDSVRHEDRASGSSLPEREMSGRDVLDETIEPLLHCHDRGGSLASRAAASLGVEKELSQLSSSAASLLGVEREISQVSSRESGGIQEELSPVLSLIQGEAVDPPREKLSHRRSFTKSQICYAITASEHDRMCCSISAAFLAILLHIGLPIPGWRILKGVVLFKPFYLLLVTNASIVLRRLILGKSGAESKTRQMSTAPTFSGNGLVQLGKALEVGMLLQNIFVALFMDFSIYAVVLICSLSLIRRFGG